MNGARRWLRLSVGIVVGIFCVVAVMTWPRMFISEERELTGAKLSLRETARFDRTSREGLAASIHRIADDSADALDADRPSLRSYPMWSAHAFDGYKRVRWQTLSELKSGPDRLLADALFPAKRIAATSPDVRSLDEALDFAASVSGRESALICGWYTERNGVVTNYFAYVLDLKQRILVKLSLLT